MFFRLEVIKYIILRIYNYNLLYLYKIVLKEVYVCLERKCFYYWIVYVYCLLDKIVVIVNCNFLGVFFSNSI